MSLPEHYAAGRTETSQSAHASTNRKTQRDTVLAWWAERGSRGATLREAADAILWRGHQIGYSAVSARMAELRSGGHLRRLGWSAPDSRGRKRANPSGAMAYIYVAVPRPGAGDAALELHLAATEYEEQIEIERGQRCPHCGGRGYIEAAPDDGAATQPELW
jgi:hypothetical protein